MNKANKRAINGILLLNKPKGFTSNYVLQKVKHLFNATKAGHTGSLDPIATGMLPICFGEATKYSQYLLNADKCYEVSARLGIKTSTADATGEIISTTESFSVSETQLLKVLEQFKGQIKQVPSMFSALKHQGVPLYKLARAGKEVERKARDITIYHLVLNEFDGQTFKLTVRCSKGTYIRNLVEDIGDVLGIGAHMTELHRVYTAGFENEPMHTMESLREISFESQLNHLLPVDQAIQYLPSLVLTADEVAALRQGKQITAKGEQVSEQLVRLFNPADEFVGLGRIDPNQNLSAHRLMAYS